MKNKKALIGKIFEIQDGAVTYIGKVETVQRNSVGNWYLKISGVDKWFPIPDGKKKELPF